MAKGGFKGNRGPMNQANMLKQAQKMQEDLMRMQNELKSATYSASSGGGAVKATVNGDHVVTELIISPDAVDPADAEMLQDLVIAAINEALRAADDASAASMSKLSGISGLF
ncbi:MAG: YbaB/EbfC family nucleoid-associated protein [Ruminococcaceae bacterium]|nr:YbaB/EbfC family nucleoid-associated protein [Oscillospiraceae bacterium]